MQDSLDGTTDFLISFKESDRAWAEHVAHFLTECGYQAELVSWAYKASRDVLHETERLGEQGTVFVPILSPAYMTTLNAEHYWYEAFRSGAFPVLPVLARECDIERLLQVHEWVDVRACSVEQARAKLTPFALKLKGPPRHTPQVSRSSESSIVPRADAALLSPMRRVPFERAEPFVDGEKTLAELRARLHDSGLAVLKSPCGGAEGFGARKLCIEYLYRNESDYRLIWVVRGSRPATLAEDFARMAQALRLPEAGRRQLPFVNQAVKRWLAANSNWLLFIHDPRCRADAEACLPAPGCGHTIINVAAGEWPDSEETVALGAWTADDAMKLAEQRLGVSAPKYSEALWGALAEHPLSYALALRLFVKLRIAPSEWCIVLEERREQLYSAILTQAPHRAALATVLSLHLSHLWSVLPACVDVLRALAYLDSHNILPGILVCGADALPGSLGALLKDDKALRKAILDLCQLGLLEERFGSITMHPAVQSQMRAWMETAPGSALHRVHPQLSHARSFALARAEGPLWARRMVKLLLHVFPPREEFEHKFKSAAKLAPHAYTVLEHAERLQIERSDCADLWVRLGEYLLFRELLGPAREALEKARVLDTHPHLGGWERRYELYRALGQVCAYASEHENARQFFELGLHHTERHFGRLSARVSELLVLLGNACRNAGDYTDAREAYEKALAVDTHLHGGPHDDVVRDLLLIGAMQQEEGALSQAWRIFSDAYLMQQALHPEPHRSHAQVARHLARVYAAMGDAPAAQQHYQLAIETALAFEGPGHPALPEIYLALGDLHAEQHAFGDARKAYKLALRGLEAVHGDNDVRLVSCMLKLGETALQRRDPLKAQPAFSRAASILLEHGETQTARFKYVEERLAQIASSASVRPPSATNSER